MGALQKKPPLRSDEYRVWIQGRPCDWCRKPSTEEHPSHHAHVHLSTEGPRGTSQKTDDLRALSLCRRCHMDDLHVAGTLGDMTVGETRDWCARREIDNVVEWFREQEAF